jgi:hypothetical protein
VRGTDPLDDICAQHEPSTRSLTTAAAAGVSVPLRFELTYRLGGTTAGACAGPLVRRSVTVRLGVLPPIS